MDSYDDDEHNGNGSSEPEQQRKLFLGGLNYDTDETGLRNYFSRFGELVDVVVMRFPDSRRSRGFGFVTFATRDQADVCFEAKPHTIDGNTIETKWATPKNESGEGHRSFGGRNDRDDLDNKDSEVHRKLFVGGLSYSTDDDQLRAYFEKFGEVVDCIVMRFRDTARSRGFGFVTYSSVGMVDCCQKARPHTIDGQRVETKRATPRDEVNKGESGHAVKKVFVGGLKDQITDEDLKTYFSEFGEVESAEQMVDKSTGKRRGFGFVLFDDYDAVDKVILHGRHTINGWRIDVKKAVSKQEMNEMRDRDGRGGGGGPPAPWGGNSFGSGYGGGGFGGGFGNGGQFGRQASPWQAGGRVGGSPWQGGGYRPQGEASWEDQGGVWGGGGGFNPGFSGGPMRSQMGGASRNAPYSIGGRGGYGGGGSYARGGW